MTPACIIGLGGYSGSGKTTLIEKALPELKRAGLYVGVLKHTSHHLLSIDTEGKDTDRFYKAGADFVAAHDGRQGFIRYQQQSDNPTDALGRFSSGLDLVIVEGHKSSSISGLWLEKGPSSRHDTADGPKNKKIIYRDDPGHLDLFLKIVSDELSGHHAERPLSAGLLIGGRSVRMGRPKALLGINGKTLVEHSLETLSEVCRRRLLLGSAELPASLLSAERLPDISGSEGPLAGMLSAFRWAPHSAWLISSVDMPLMSGEAWKWLLGLRRPGVWAIMPRIEGSETVETTGACYEPMLFDYIESFLQKGIKRLQTIADHPKVLKPVIPKSLEAAWKNVNTPEEWKDIRSLKKKQDRNNHVIPK